MNGGVLGIVQARVSSTRLPGKVLLDIEGVPMLLRVTRRLAEASRVDRLVVATSSDPSDDPIAGLCESAGVSVFRGSLADVLDRYRAAALQHDGATIVRVTADCPLLDPGVVDAAVAMFSAGGYDYVSNVSPPTFPDGLDVEVFSRDALERTWAGARLTSEREHVTLHLRNHPESFRAGNVRHRADLSALRWTVDRPEDLEFVRAVYRLIGQDRFGMQDVLALLASRPALAGINAGQLRNEGLTASLRLDRPVS